MFIFALLEGGGSRGEGGGGSTYVHLGLGTRLGSASIRRLKRELSLGGASIAELGYRLSHSGVCVT